MNGIHDMGGMHGFGAVVREADEPIFHAAWEGRVRAMMALSVAQGIFNLDEFRFGIERMPPADYLDASYFERWLASVEYNLLVKGVLSSDEVDARLEGREERPAEPAPIATPVHSRPTPYEPLRLTFQPRFAVGDRVVTRNIQPRGHTRLPRYTRGKHGTVNLVHGPEIFPDTNAHGLGSEGQVVYNVLFQAQELWGESAEPRQTLSIDLWESYLEPDP